MDARRSGSRKRAPARPAGDPPPAEVTLPGGGQVDVGPLAREIAERHLAAHPETLAAYDDPDVVRAWCEHDNRHLLAWAAAAARGLTDLVAQTTWLARVLDARGHPPALLAADLRVAAEVVEARVDPDGAEVAAQLRRAAEHVATLG